MDRKGANTFPFYNLPPVLKISKKEFFCAFFSFQLDQIKVGGDSYLPRHFANTNAKCTPALKIVPVLPLYHRTGDSAGEYKWGIP